MTRVEQKLVDTMLVADLIHLAINGEMTIAVVSSDDDFWPGILSAMTLGAHVVHIGTKYAPSHRMYLSSLGNNYSKAKL